MQDKDEILDDDLDGLPKVSLYTKNTIIWYAFLFSPFVGGVLFAINLFRLNKQGTALLIALATLVYTLATYYISTFIIYRSSGRLLILLLNLVGGNLLTGPSWRLTIGQLTFKKASGWYPLIFVLAAYAVIFLVAMFLLGNPLVYLD